MEEHRSDGALPTSVRFLFYELVARSIIAKEGDRPDKIVSEALTDLRERGLVRWEDIVDETRSVDDFSGSATVADDWLAYLGAARLDPWKGQVPFLLTESRSLGGVLRGLVRDYRGRIAPTNGQVGGFLHTDVAPYLKPGDRCWLPRRSRPRGRRHRGQHAARAGRRSSAANSTGSGWR